jgi:hypothetical protein
MSDVIKGQLVKGVTLEMQWDTLEKQQPMIAKSRSSRAIGHLLSAVFHRGRCFGGGCGGNVASVLEISKEGVLTRLSRARKELRRLLEVKEEDATHIRAMRKHS